MWNYRYVHMFGQSMVKPLQALILLVGFNVIQRLSSVGSISSGSSSQLRLPLIAIGKKLLLVIHKFLSCFGCVFSVRS